MHPQIDPADIHLLRAQGMNEEDLQHSVQVAELALDIAARVNAPVDMELVGRGALFHDLGKVKTHAIEHGRIGAELGVALGLPQEVRDVMEKHIRGGLSPQEARELGLPDRDYALHRLEERIIIYADRLVDIITDPSGLVASAQEAQDRFQEILQAYPRYGKNAPTMARYFEYHREIQALIAEADNESLPV